MEHSYLGDENKDLIGNICKSKLKYDEDLSLTGFDNGKFSLIQRKKILMWMIDCLISRNPLKICQMLTIYYIRSQIIKNPKQTEHEDIRDVVSILNAVKKSIDFSPNCETISKLIRYQPQILDKMLSKYSKHSKPVGEIVYYYDGAIKYSNSDLEETIAEIVELNP